jgi:hypothetical protein
MKQTTADKIKELDMTPAVQEAMRYGVILDKTLPGFTTFSFEDYSTLQLPNSWIEKVLGIAW